MKPRFHPFSFYYRFRIILIQIGKYTSRSTNTAINRAMGRYLTELEGMLFSGELKIPANKDKHTAGRTRWLTIDGIDVVLALLERETGKLRYDILSTLNLHAFEA